MKPDQFEESQRLTSLYSEMGEIEIRELAAGIEDLTEVAKQVLRDELKKRGMSGDASAVRSARPKESGVGIRRRFKRPNGRMRATMTSRAEFTWKTRLCECNTSEEATGTRVDIEESGNRRLG